MFACLIIGDSIGVGMSRAIGDRYAGQCDKLVEERGDGQPDIVLANPEQVLRDHAARCRVE